MARFQRFRRLWHRISVVRLLENAIIAMVALQAIIVLVLNVVATLRQRHKTGVHFQPLRLDEVQVGDNYLQLYGYGRDLYAAMLDAIDNARESIYLESYILKGDVVGQEL